MKKIVFNNFANSREKLPLDNASRLFMLKELGIYPRESVSPRYNKKQYYDSYKKYFIYGGSVAAVGNDSVRVINIVGRAYGFLIDCAYIIDLKNNIEFLLSSSVCVNESGKIGSGKYEFEQIGLPFLKDLSWCIYKYETTRQGHLLLI